MTRTMRVSHPNCAAAIARNKPFLLVRLHAEPPEQALREPDQHREDERREEARQRRRFPSRRCIP